MMVNQYQLIRAEALKQTKNDFEDEKPHLKGFVSLTEITEKALSEHDKWDIPQNRQVGWNWRDAINNYKNVNARIELAIWHNQELCGLMLGKASDGKLVVKINYVQGGNFNNPMKGYIVPIATRYAELFANAIGSEWVGIQDPLDEVELIEYYKKLGFDQSDPFDHRNNALYKRLE